MERRKGDAADSVPERTNAPNGFSNELMYGQNTEKKRLVLYGRLNDVRRKCGGDKLAGTRENREPKAYGRRTRKREGIYTTILK